MKPLSFEGRILVMVLGAGLPGSAVALALLWTGEYTPKVQWTLSVLILAVWLTFAFMLRYRTVFHLQTLSNLLSALREGDYSIRARGSKSGDAFSDVVIEVNALGETLREQRLGALEATALLRKVMEEIDVAVFTFDGQGRLRLVNRAGERLLAQPIERLLGQSANPLGLEECLRGGVAQTREMQFPGGGGRWGIRRTTFRQHGLPHNLLVLTDLSRPLREEERQAWQRLIRVLGHELNNSLTPIRSIAQSLESLLGRGPLPDDWRDDMNQGLRIISTRTESLSRFMNAYALLAKLPPPSFASVDITLWIRRVAELETRLRVVVRSGPDLTMQADGDQLEQLLINLVRNAVDASLETGGGVTVDWKKNGRYIEVLVEDEGPGLPNTKNLFVPFFTTKRGGSGIGLVLCRQIAEAHGGSLTLQNRAETQGCQARLRLPL